MQIYDVFISYRRSDGATLANQIYDYLTRNGLRVFWDKESIIDGHYFTDQIEQNLRRAPNYILVVSNNVFAFHDDDWVQREIDIALEAYEMHKEERTVTVLVAEGVRIPQRSELPDNICRIMDVQMIMQSHAEWMQKILQSVTAVNRSNLRNGAHRWLEHNRQERGRFAGLNVVEEILPQATQKAVEKTLDIRIREGKPDGQEHPLLKTILSSSDHGYLIGQGGIGKTTALLHIMDSAYNRNSFLPNGQTPIFVELSYAPDTNGELYRNGKSSYIRRMVFGQVWRSHDDDISRRSDLAQVFRLPKEVAVDPVDAVFAKRMSEPEYLLLLDGLNEVSTVILQETGCSILEMIIEEIRLLMSEYPNVQVLLTSRSDDPLIQDRRIIRYYLTGVHTDDIKNYLRSCGFSAEQVEKTMKNSALAETLRIPLFLTMYAKLSDRDHALTQGEILRLYFGERRRNMVLYTMSGRFEDTEKDISSSSNVQSRRVTTQMQNFMLDFVLPEIAWYMEREGRFHLPLRMIREHVRAVLFEQNDFNARSEFGQEVFSQYSSGRAGFSTESTAKSICESFGSTEHEVIDRVIDCCTFSLGVLQRNDRYYRFAHQHIRDYFAAVKNINTLHLAVYMYSENEHELALECMNSVFAEKPLSMTVRRFIGEALGEQYNRPLQTANGTEYGVPMEPQDRNLIERALNIYRGAFDGGIGYGLFSLVKIMSEVRTVLAGVDFSDLDLTRCQLNGTGLGIEGLAANMRGAKLRAENLFVASHRKPITHLAYSPDGRQILSASADDTAKLWHSLTGELLHTFEFDECVLMAEYVNEGREIMTVTKNSNNDMFSSWVSIQLWHGETFDFIRESFAEVQAKYAVLSSDKKHLLLWDDEGYSVVRVDTLEVVWSHNIVHKTDGLIFAGFLDDERIVTISGQNGEGHLVKTLCLSDHSFRSYDSGDCPLHAICLNPVKSEAALLIASKSRCYLRVIESKTHRIIMEQKISDHDSRVLRYSNDGKWLCVSHSTESWSEINRRKHWITLYRTSDYAFMQDFPSAMMPAAFDRDCNKLATTDPFNGLHSYDLNSLEAAWKLNGISLSSNHVSLFPGVRWIATCSDDHRVRLWNKDTLTLEREAAVHADSLHYLTSGIELCITNKERNLVLSVPGLQDVDRYPEDCTISPDGRFVAVWYLSDESCIYDALDYNRICEVRFAPGIDFKDNYAWEIEQDGYFAQTLYVYDLKKGCEVLSLEDCCSVDICGNYLAVLIKDYFLWDDSARLLVWNLQPEPSLCIELDTPFDSHWLKYSADGKHLIVLGEENIVVRESAHLEIIQQMEKEEDDRFYLGEKTFMLCGPIPDDRRSSRIAIYRIDTMVRIAEIEFDLWHPRVLAYSDHEVLLHKSDDTILCYRITEGEIVLVGPITIAPGLDVMGVDLRQLHPECNYTPEQMRILRQYGANI